MISRATGPSPGAKREWRRSVWLCAGQADLELGRFAVDLDRRPVPQGQPSGPHGAGQHSIDGGAPVNVGGPRTVPASWFSGAAGPAVGIISTSTGPAPSFLASWDFIEVQPP